MTLRLATALLLAAAPALAQTPIPTRSLAGPVPSNLPVPSVAPVAPVATVATVSPPPMAAVAAPRVSTLGPVAASPSADAADSAPLPDAVVRQAIDQADGHFPPLDRAGGGQIQEAWNVSEPRDGVYATRVCEACVYKVRTREFMTTTLVLPPDAEIVAADLGDATGFKVEVRGANQIAVRPSAYGLDTNLNVTTRSGAVYPFYIRSEGFNSRHVPDLVVRLLGREQPEGVVLPPPAAPEPPKGKETGAPPKEKSDAALHDLAHPKAPAGDFARAIAFDPAKLRGWHEYRLWGDGADDLSPEVVYRDDVFTYIRYGEKWDGMELSTAYVTIDGVDELVNSRVQGSTFIVESVAPLITLKNGKRFLCIQYTGKS
jgi:ComB9 competence protein